MSQDSTYRLSEGSAEWIAARAVLGSLFTTPGPFLPVFGPGAEARRLLFPVELDLDQETWTRLRTSGRLYISTTDQWDRFGFDEQTHWVTDSDSPPFELLGQTGWNYLEEIAVYAADGSIAVLVSREEHAVIAGERAPVEALCRDDSRCISGIEASLPREFVEKWVYCRDHYGTNLSIVQSLLERTFGEASARSMMRAFERSS